MFSDINKQITILQSRGLKIDNNSKTRNLLIDHNYYNVINGFKEPFLDKSQSTEVYKTGTTFEEIFALYEFDRKLRNLILDYTLLIENSLKTKIAYEFAKKYGEYAYLNSSSYTFKTHHQKNNTIKLLARIMDKIEKESNSGIYSHFISLGREIPVWAATSFFDFGTVRTFYSCLEDSLAFDIANYYSINKTELISFLSNINMYRNVCAHDNRIMRYMIFKKEFSISNTKIHSNMNLNTDSKNEYIVGKRDLFALLISFKYLLREEIFTAFFNKINSLFQELKSKLNTIPIEDIYKEYRLPLNDVSTGQKDWKEIATISKQ